MLHADVLLSSVSTSRARWALIEAPSRIFFRLDMIATERAVHFSDLSGTSGPDHALTSGYGFTQRIRQRIEERDVTPMRLRPRQAPVDDVHSITGLSEAGVKVSTII
jgi:hypothetical protein